MQRESRARPREDDGEAGIVEPDDATLSFELARAIEVADPAAVGALLEGQVRLRSGSSLGDEGVGLEDVERADTTHGYRDAASYPLARALGTERVARVWVDLLARAAARKDTRAATTWIRARHAGERTLFEAMARDARGRAPEALAAIAEIAPDVVRMSSEELMVLARRDREAIVAALPRLALGLPALSGKPRRAAEELLHAIAPLHHPHAPLALAALLRAGAAVDRTRDGLTPIERAAEESALANLRVFEDAGARLGKPSRKKDKDRRRAEDRAAQKKRAGQRTALASPDAPSRAVARKRAEVQQAVRSRDVVLHRALLLALGGVVLALLVLIEPRAGAVMLGVIGLVLAVAARAGRAIRWGDWLRGRDRNGDR